MALNNDPWPSVEGILTEVPLLFPPVVDSGAVYVVNDSERSIILSNEVEDSSNGGEDTTRVAGDDSFAQGSASVSSFESNGRKNGMILTTVALAEKPWILSVALLRSEEAACPLQIHLDLGSKTVEYEKTVKVQASFSPNNNSIDENGESFDCREEIELILVDNNGVVLTIRLDPKTLVPESSFECLNIRNLLDDGLEDLVAPSPIQSSAVVILPEYKKIVLSFNPFLLAVDLQNGDIAVWSKDKCLEEMKNRRSTFGNILSKGVDLAFGKLESDAMVDMNPVSALVAADNDPNTIFSLHNDGVLRRWSLRPTLLHPRRVDEIKGHMKYFPSNENWSDTENSTVLTARCYGSGKVFGLAVYVKTSSDGDDDVVEQQSPTGEVMMSTSVSGSCRLVVVDGSTFGDRDPEVEDSVIALEVPHQATELVSMSFDPSEGARCSLKAVFRTTKPYVTTETTKLAFPKSVHLSYPPSLHSMVSPNPICSVGDETLDQVAANERQDICNLDFFLTIQDDCDTSTLDEILHELDTRYMKRLFRPSYPRGTGTCSPPTDSRILHSLQKMVPNYRNRSFGEPRHSIQVETLLAMHQWRLQEQRRNLCSLTPVKQVRNRDPQTPTTDMATATPGVGSIYDSLVPMEEEDAAVDLLREDEENEDRDREQEIKAHERRWRQLLLAIWEEEEMDRAPLLYSVLPSEDPSIASATAAIIVVRPGFTSAVMTQEASRSTIRDTGMNATDKLVSTIDMVAIKMMEAIGDGSQSMRELLKSEKVLWESISESKLAFVSTSRDMLRSFYAFEEETVYDFMDQRESDELSEGLKTSCKYGLATALQSMFLSSNIKKFAFPGLQTLDEGTGHSWSLSNATGEISNSQLRLATASFALRAIDSIRRLLLGRLLVLVQLTAKPYVVETALRMYLHTLTILWTWGQRIKVLPQRSLENENTQRLLEAGRDASQLSRRPSHSPPPRKRLSVGKGALTGKLCTVLDSFFDSIISRGLGMLGGTSQRCAATMQSSCVALLAGEAIRLCFQFHAGMGSEETECRSSSSKWLPELGVLFYLSSGSDKIEYPKLALRLVAPYVALPCASNGQSNLAASREELLAECLLMASHSEFHEKKAVQMVERAFDLLWFDVSKLEKSMCHIETLERHLGGDSSRVSGMFLRFVESAVKKMDDQYDECFRQDYIKLLSALCRVAIGQQRWTVAYRACINNPEAGRRANELSGLVRAMVNAGALNDLLKMCTHRDVASKSYAEILGQGMDLYGTAADTLTEAASHDIYSLLAESNSSSEPLSDYQSALYALHVSQGEWRKAAQAMDLRFVSAKKAFVNGPSGLKQDSDKILRRDNLIVDDLVLAAVASYNAISLLPDITHRFIVSGEFGSYPSIPINLWGSKRSRGTGQSKAIITTENNDPKSTNDRLSSYMNADDLEARAARSSVLRILFRDGLKESIIAKDAFLNKDSSKASDGRTIIDELFLRGYYFQGLVLAKTISKVQGTKPDGRDLYCDCLSHLLCAYLVPLALNQSLSEQRPTFSQVHSVFCAVQEKQTLDLSPPPILVGCRHKKKSSLPNAGVRLAIMSLLKSLTTRYTTAEQPIAAEVASCMLNVEGTHLPAWLEKLLIEGTSSPEMDTSMGLFARRPMPGSTKYLGDPSTLLSLYIDRGFYREACNVVTAVILSACSRVSEMKSTKLPEKGGIDFVPYNKINLLWNLIDIALSRGDFQGNAAETVKMSRDEMEQSLKKYFELVKTNEMGLASARALT